MKRITRENPNQKFEIVPHVISVETDVINEGGSISYHMEIPLVDVPEGFLLMRINTRQNTQSIRIRKGSKVYYLAPGWLHWIHHDFFLYPALFIKGGSWFIDVSFSRYVDYQHDVKTLQIGLIGQRVVKL